MGLLDDVMSGWSNAVLSGDRRGAGTDSAGNSAAASSSYDRLQKALAENYAQQQQADPNWQMPGPQERFVDQVQAMILSGDPILQKRGLELLDKPAERQKSTTEKEWEFLNSGGGNYSRAQVFNMMHPGPARNTTNVSIKNPMPSDGIISLDDLSKLTTADGRPLPPGTTWGQAQRLGATATQSEQQTTRAASTDAAAMGLENLVGNLEAGKDTGARNALDIVRSGGGTGSKIVNYAANAIGIPQNRDVELFNQANHMVSAQMLKIMSGASATEGEFARIQGLYPNLTDSMDVRIAKTGMMLDEAEMFIERARKNGVTDLPDLSKARRQVEALKAKYGYNQQGSSSNTRVTKSGVKYTVE